MRTNKSQWFLDLARRCAEQGTCLRRNYGAVIVDPYETIVSTGYTGAPSGEQHCKICWRENFNIPPGKNYEFCRSVHAEVNALIQAGKEARGATIYIVGLDAKTQQILPMEMTLPCFMCSKVILNAGIKRIVAGEYVFTTNPVDCYLEQEERIFKDAKKAKRMART